MTSTTSTTPVTLALADNPFYVLAVAPDASRIEIEREAQKLLGMLELGFAAAAEYATPVGPRPRTPEGVRAAVAALRDPRARLIAELWARNAPAVATASRAVAGTQTGGPAPGAGALRRSLGWRP